MSRVPFLLCRGAGTSAGRPGRTGRGTAAICGRGTLHARHRFVVTSAVLAAVLLSAQPVDAQLAGRRLTTIEALRRFPAFFQLQNVLLRGELVESGQRIVLRSDDDEMRVVMRDVQSRGGAVEVRAQFVDVGRLDPSDPRATPFTEGRDTERWPRPGEELVLNVTGVMEAQTAATPSIRALALEPWKFEGQRVTVVGNFRGRNLFGDLPDAPGTGRYDFVLRGAEGAVWVTGLRPRGRGFDLDIDRRMDTDRWLQVTGVVVRDRGLASLASTELALATPPAVTAPTEESAAPPPPARPLDVVFNSPTEGETGVSPATTVRVQFSRGLEEASLAGRIRASYLGAPAGDPNSNLPFRIAYDAATRSIEITFEQPLERFRTVKIELLDGIRAFDSGALAPWMLTFSVG